MANEVVQLDDGGYGALTTASSPVNAASAGDITSFAYYGLIYFDSLNDDANVGSTRGSSAAAGDFLFRLSAGSGAIQGYLYDLTPSAGSDASLTSGGSGIAVGWNKVAFRWNGSEIKIFANGNASAGVSRSFTFPAGHSSRLFIGEDGSSTSTDEIDGDWAEGAFWKNTIPSDAELEDITDGTSSPQDFSPDHYWTSEGGSGSTVSDTVGSLDLTLGTNTQYYETTNTPVPWIDPSSGPDITTGVEFDGTNDYLTRGADLTGTADGKVGTLSFWFKMPATTGAQRIFECNNSGRFFVNNQDGAIEIWGYDTGGTNRLRLISDSAWDDDEWHHCLAVWDVASATGALYIDDASDETYVDRGDAAIDLTGTDWAVGAISSGSNKFDGCLAELYFAQEYLGALTTVANRRKFIGADLKPVALGSDGSTPTGTAPIVYLSGGAAQFGTNFGSGGDFTVTGTLVDCAVNRAYSLAAALTASAVPAATMVLESGEAITGDVTATLTPVGAFSVTREHRLAASLVASLTPAAALDVTREHRITGDVTGVLTPAATLAVLREYRLSGALTATLTPDSAMTLAGAAAIVGSVTLSAATAAGLVVTREHRLAGAVPFASVPGAGLTFEAAAAIIGDVAHVFIPAASMRKTLRAALAGDITYLSVPDAALTFVPVPAGERTFLDQLALDVDAFFVLTTDAPFTDDLEIFMDTADGFAQTATHPTLGSFAGIFTDEDLVPGGDLVPASLLCKAISVENVALGDTVTVDGRDFVVDGRRPDGLGLTTLTFRRG